MAQQGPDLWAGGSTLPHCRRPCCILLCPALWLSGMTGSVIDIFINMATRRGGRTGHLCLSVAVPDSRL